MNQHLVLDLPIRRQRQVLAKKIVRRKKVIGRPKRGWRSSRIKTMRKDLVAPARKKAEKSFAEAMRKQFQLGVLNVTYRDSISFCRGKSFRALKGAVSSSVRGRKQALYFAKKKSILVMEQLRGEQYVKPTGTRRQKWIASQAELAKIAKGFSAVVHTLPDGSYNRRAATEAGGYLTKTLGHVGGSQNKTDEQLDAEECGHEYEAAYARGDVSEEDWQQHLQDAIDD